MPAIRKILKTYWGYDAFRPLQEEVISSVLEGQDTLALMPTGGGKSICYQVPALARDGLCLVVSPLIALMKDQVESLRGKGIRAQAVFSGMRPAEIDGLLDNCVYGDYKFLYLSPERLQTDLARERIKRMKVNLIAVDEAHCISQWGYDFRPAYLEIAALRELIPDVPVLALTATATSRVEEDILKQLRFRSGQGQVFRGSFARKNLAYMALREENKTGRLLKICGRVPGSGIVYARNRRETQDIASFLQRKRISAAFYHAGMDMKKRESVQDSWLAGKTRVMVATNAFGMGIDKPDVRFVVHMDIPDSLEAYYQEAGRAGRDGKPSYAVLLFSSADENKLLENIDISYPAPREIRNIYQALGNYFQLAIGAGEGLSFDLDIGEFCRRYQLYAPKLLNAFRFLEKDRYLSFSEGVSLPSRLRILCEQGELYRLRVAEAEYDNVLKTVLRSYGGVFDSHVPVDEKLLARRAGMLFPEFLRALQQLHARKIISYLPRTDQPQVTYLSPRADARNMYLDTGYIRERKAHYSENVRSVIAYASDEETCRSRLLLSYFGETAAEDCGSCDHCRKLHREDVSGRELERIREEIMSALGDTSLSLPQLTGRLPAYPEKKVLAVVRLLLEEGSLVSRAGEIILRHPGSGTM